MMGTPELRKSLFLAYRIVGNLDVDAFLRAVHTVVGRHDALRLAIGVDGQGGWRMYPRDPPTGPALISCISVTSRSDEQFARFVRSRLRAIVDEPWDLLNGFPFRIHLLRRDPTHHALIAAFSHALLDGRSKALFTRWLWTYYGHYVAGRPPPPPAGGSYLDATRRLAGQQSGTGDTAGQREVPPRLSPRCQFGLVARPPDEARGRTDRRVLLGAGERDAIAAQCLRYRCTPFQWLLAVFTSIVLDICPQDRVAVHVPIDLRQPDERAVLGMFIMVMPVAITRQADLAALVRHVRERVLHAVAHRHAYRAAVADPAPRWGVGSARNLAANMLAFPPARALPQPSDLTLHWDFVAPHVHPAIGLEMDVVDEADRLVVELGFDRAIFTDPVIEDLVTLFTTRCADGTAEPTVGPVGRDSLIPLCDPDGTALLYADGAAIERVLRGHPHVVTASVRQERASGQWSELVATVIADGPLPEAELRGRCDSAYDPDRFILTPQRFHIEVQRRTQPVRDRGSDG